MSSLWDNLAKRACFSQREEEIIALVNGIFSKYSQKSSWSYCHVLLYTYTFYDMTLVKIVFIKLCGVFPDRKYFLKQDIVHIIMGTLIDNMQQDKRFIFIKCISSVFNLKFTLEFFLLILSNYQKRHSGAGLSF